MAIEIKNYSDGTLAGVTTDNQLRVVSENQELQHFISWVKEDAYQVIAHDTGITAQNQTILHIKNTSSTKKCVISFIRLSAITNTASKPVVGEYWQMGVGDTIASGGSTVTPVNMNASSGRVAEVTCTTGDPTEGDTFTEIDRVYNQNNEHTYNKQGSIILGLNDTFSIKLLSAGTGQATARVTFMMIDNDA